MFEFSILLRTYDVTVRISMADCEACIFREGVAVLVALIVFVKLPVLFEDGKLAGARGRAERRQSLGRGSGSGSTSHSWLVEFVRDMPFL